MVNCCTVQLWLDTIEEYSEAKLFLKRYCCAKESRITVISLSILHVPVSG